jgi:hypothetical protein
MAKRHFTFPRILTNAAEVVVPNPRLAALGVGRRQLELLEGDVLGRAAEVVRP